MDIGGNIIRLSKIGSTNDFTFNLIERESVNDGTVVVAYEQTAGKGQQGSTWFSEKGKNLTFSIVLYPRFLKPDEQFYLSKSISLGIIDYLNSEIQIATIKWPNDIYVENNKLGGILIENTIIDNKIHHSVAGIGLNMNQTEFSNMPSSPASLKMITGKDYNLETELEIICNYLTERYNILIRRDFSLLDKEYLNNLFGYGEFRRYLVNNKIFEAKITGVSKYGKLMLQTRDDEERLFDFKEVEFII
jgi:BirA family biotin operon repressor/biotin-[acetyl-CoA-carboxylase] ligase